MDGLLTPADRIELLASMGLELYLSEDAELRARGPRDLLEIATPALRRHRAGLVAHLRERSVESSGPEKQRQISERPGKPRE
jgi:hypothetical protein